MFSQAENLATIKTLDTVEPEASDTSTSKPINESGIFTPDAFLSRKKIDLNIFQNIELTFQSSIAEHSKFAFQHFYSKSYLKETEKKEGIARYHHGIAHANRVASYIPVFANLYRKHHYKDAMQLTDDDVKLTQLAGLFHDTCREDDGKDLWDADSGTLLYLYLKAIGVDENKCKLLAEAIANKDTVSHDSYQELKIHADGSLSWEKVSEKPRNMYQRLLHDGDCIDIIRARDHFDATYLDFYKKIAKKNSLAHEEMAQLITEVRSVIEKQGDSRQVSKPEVKAEFERQTGFKRSLKTFKGKSHYFILPALYKHGKLLEQAALEKSVLVDTEKYDPTKGLDEANIYRAMREGKLLARGEMIVSGVSAKKITKNDGTTEEESLGAIDIRKAARRLGVPTSSSKPNKDGSKPNIEKQGNPNRSVTMLGYGASTFSDAGFLIVNPNKEQVTTVSAIDSDTGFRKKKYSNDPFNQLTTAEKEKKLNELHQLLMHGGLSRHYDSFLCTHNELTYNIDRFDAIYYTLDPNFRNAIDLGNPRAFHRWAPFLKAYYLQNEYKKKHGKVLPIFEYSGLHNGIRLVKPEEYSNEAILKMWSEMVGDYYNHFEETFNDMTTFATKSPDEIKVLAMYGLDHLVNNAYLASRIAPADNNYPDDLQRAITQKVLELKQNRYDTHYTDFGRLLLAALTDDLEKFMTLYEPIDKSTFANSQSSDCLMRAIIYNASEKIFSWFLPLASHDLLEGVGNANGVTPVYVAASWGHASILKRLIGKGANPNKANNEHDTPLRAAILSNKPECVEILLDANVNPNEVWVDKVTPLAEAITYNRAEIISVLLKKGADANQLCFRKPTTPFMFAILLITRSEIVTQLLDHGVKVDATYPIHVDCVYIANKNKSFKDKLSAFYAGNIPETLMLTPLQFAAFSGNTAVVKLLLARGALLTVNAQGKKAIRMDHVMGQDSLGSLLIDAAPAECQALIREAIAGYAEHLKEDESITEVAENKALMDCIRKHTCYAGYIIEAYWKQHQKPLVLDDRIDYHDIISDGKRFLAVINTGKVVGFDKDSAGRYLTNVGGHVYSVQYDNGYFSDFTGCDFSKINFGRFTFEKFKFSETHWHFAPTDNISFLKCHMDDFSITKNSDLSGVRIIDPIFSGAYAAGKVAALFDTIPSFILKAEYINEVKKLIAAGKKINFGDNWATYNCLHGLLTKNHLELFCVVLKSLEQDTQYSKYFKDLMAEAMDIGDRESFIEAILKHQVVDLENNHQVRNELMCCAIDNKKYHAIPMMLSYDANAADIINHKHVFEILRSVLDNEYKNQAKKKQSVSLATAHVTDRLPFYPLAERLLNLCAYMSQHEVGQDDKLLANKLIDQLEQAYVDSCQGKEVAAVLQKIRTNQMLLLKHLGRNHPLLKKALYVNERGVNRFASNMLSDHELHFVAKQLSNDDIDDLCIYLTRNPQISNVSFYKIALSPANLAALTSVSTVTKMEFRDCKLTDAAARVFAEARYLEKLSIYNHEMTLTGAKAIRGNTTIKKISCGSNKHSEEICQAWMKIIKEKDPAMHRVYADEAKKEYADSVKKYEVLNAHVVQLEKQLKSVGDGKRARCKKNNLREQVQFFRSQQAAMQTSTELPSNKVRC